jgi:hypothetical protein
VSEGLAEIAGSGEGASSVKDMGVTRCWSWTPASMSPSP